MARNQKKFGNQFTEIIVQISVKEDKPRAIVHEEVGEAIYVGVGTIENMRRGRHLIRPDTEEGQHRIELLTRYLVQKNNELKMRFDREWFKDLLDDWGHYHTLRDELLDELFPPDAPILPTRKHPALLRDSKIKQFVGREAELKECQQQLKDENLVYITGMTGIGKTTLGVFLAISEFAENAWSLKTPQILASLWRYAEPYTFYFKLQNKDDLPRIIHRLAEFLNYHGDPTFYDLLQNMSVKHYPTLWEQILTTMENSQYLLCFDNFHELDKELEELVMDQLIEKTKRGTIKVIIISGKMYQGVKNMNLEGLVRDEFRDFVNHSSKNGFLSEASIESLFVILKGHPLIASVLLDYIGKTDAQLEDILTEADELLIELIFTKIDEKLEEEERTAMKALAVCMENEASIELLQSIADGKNLRRPLWQLRSKNHVQYSIHDKIYTYHTMVKQFYYKLLDHQECLAMHARAADYYSERDSKPFQAAYHYHLAERYAEAAAQLMGEHCETIVNQGYARAAGRLLESIQEHLPQDAGYQSQLATTLGAFYYIQGEYDEAMIQFETGHQLTDDPHREIDFLYEMLRVYRSQNAFDQALEIAEQISALADQQGSGFSLPAKVLNGIGWVYTRLKKLEEAAFYYNQAWDEDGHTLEPDIAAQTLLGLGAVALRQGKYQEAEEHFLDCLQRFQQLKNLIGEIQSLNNLGVVYQEQEQNEKALEYLEEMLGLVESIGNTYSAVIGHYNIAITRIQQGQYLAAKTNLIEGIEKAERIANYPMICRCNANLVRVALDMNDVAEAKQQLAKAETACKQGGKEIEHGIVYYVSSEIALAEAQYREALDLSEQAIPLLERVDEKDYLPFAQTVRSQAQANLDPASPSDAIEPNFDFGIGGYRADGEDGIPHREGADSSEIPEDIPKGILIGDEPES